MMPTPEVPSLPAASYPRRLVVVLGVAGSLVALLALRELAWLLAPVSLAFMIVFWARVLGPIGAILAVPLTLLVKALIIDSDPRAAWAEALIGPTRSRRRRRRRET